jgi:hypothetical protein
MKRLNVVHKGCFCAFDSGKCCVASVVGSIRKFGINSYRFLQ